MRRKTARRWVHLAGEQMTACGKIMGGSLVARASWQWVAPEHRCTACARAVEAWKARRQA